MRCHDRGNVFISGDAADDALVSKAWKVNYIVNIECLGLSLSTVSTTRSPLDISASAASIHATTSKSAPTTLIATASFIFKVNLNVDGLFLGPVVLFLLQQITCSHVQEIPHFFSI